LGRHRVRLVSGFETRHSELKIVQPTLLNSKASLYAVHACAHPENVLTKYLEIGIEVQRGASVLVGAAMQLVSELLLALEDVVDARQ
jgi:hypothetical protein